MPVFCPLTYSLAASFIHLHQLWFFSQYLHNLLTTYLLALLSNPIPPSPSPPSHPLLPH
jgi:hypothetical protein